MTRLLPLLCLVLLAGCKPRPDPSAALSPDTAALVAHQAAVILATGGYIRAHGQSMTPSIPDGAHIVYRQSWHSVRAGNVLVYRDGIDIIAHRAVRQTADGWVVRGDNRRYPDAATVTADNYIGTVAAVVW